jgi:antitoxin StbD
MAVLKTTMDMFVPISRFNKGEAGKIFKEVAEKGMKIVLKNNEPECVLLDPKKYDEMVARLEDYELYLEAERRMQDADRKFVAAEDVYKKAGITEKMVADTKDVELDKQK